MNAEIGRNAEGHIAMTEKVHTTLGSCGTLRELERRFRDLAPEDMTEINYGLPEVFGRGGDPIQELLNHEKAHVTEGIKRGYTPVKYDFSVKEDRSEGRIEFGARVYYNPPIRNREDVIAILMAPDDPSEDDFNQLKKNCW